MKDADNRPRNGDCGDAFIKRIKRHGEYASLAGTFSTDTIWYLQGQLYPPSSLDGDTSSDFPEYEHHAHRPIGHQDIIYTIMDICEAEKSYGTLALLGSISQLHHELVAPRLRRIKKRVVLNLNDYRWDKREKYGNIEYATLRLSAHFVR